MVQCKYQSKHQRSNVDYDNQVKTGAKGDKTLSIHQRENSLIKWYI